MCVRGGGGVCVWGGGGRRGLWAFGELIRDYMFADRIFHQNRIKATKRTRNP